MSILEPIGLGKRARQSPPQPVAEQRPSRVYPSYVEGLHVQGADGVDRARYCAERLAPGAALDLASDADNPALVAIRHDGQLIGHVPTRHVWAAECLAEGAGLVSTVVAVETGGWLRRRARRVEIEIAVVANGASSARFARRITDGTKATVRAAAGGTLATVRAAADGTKATVRAAADAGRAAGWLARNAASWTGETFVKKPARLVSRSVDGVTEVTVRRPYRFARRMVYIGIGLLVGVPLLMIIVLLLLHSLPLMQALSRAPVAQ